MAQTSSQQELHALRHRVVAMASRRSPRPLLTRPASATPDDCFTQQINELKEHVAELENALHEAPHALQDAFRGSASLRTSCLALRPIQHDSDTASIIAALSSLSAEVKASVNVTNERFADVQRGLSDLEDRLDRLDPTRFTPPGSESSLDDETDPFTAVRPETDAIERYAPRSDYADRLAALHASSALPQAVPSADVVKPPGANKVRAGLMRAKLGAAEASLAMLQQYSSNMTRGAYRLYGDDAVIIQNILRLHSALVDETKVPYTESGRSSKDKNGIPDDPPVAVFPQQGSAQTSDICSRKISLPVTELDVPGSTCAAPRALHQLSGPMIQPEGVVFRDQEISRLDDQLRAAQESARASEQQVENTQVAFSDLQHRVNMLSQSLSDSESANRAREDEILKFREEAAQQGLHIQQLNDYLQTKNEQRERLMQSCVQLQDRSREKTAVIYDLERRLEEAQRNLQDCQSRKDDEIEQMVQSREDEIRRLQQFCEQKDVVIRSQEEIIARGATLMEQKDEDIATLTEKLHEVDDERSHERRQRRTTVRLLEQRDAELLELRQGNTAAGGAQSTTAPGTRAAIDEHSQRHMEHGRKSDAQHGHAVSKIFGVPSPDDGPTSSWSPQPISGNKTLPHESRRASAWEQSGDRERAAFGHPSSIGYWPQVQPPRRHRSSLHPQKIRHLVNGQLANASAAAHAGESADESGRPPLPARSRSTKESKNRLGTAAAHDVQRPTQRDAGGRRTLPLDRPVWPPLPAPIGVNRIQSMSNLRLAEDDAHHRRISKHQSMRELRRRDLQPYVETEAESGGEPDNSRRSN
jgi:hypothetical protein